MTYVLIAVSIFAYTASLLAFSRGAQYLNANILGAIINFMGTLVPLGLFLLVASQRYTLSGPTSKGYLWALAGGVGIAAFTLTMTRLFANGENVSFITPLVYGSAVLLASVIGILFYKEKASLIQFSGLLFIVVGILLISFATWRGSKI